MGHMDCNSVKPKTDSDIDSLSSSDKCPLNIVNVLDDIDRGAVDHIPGDSTSFWEPGTPQHDAEFLH